MEVAGCPHNESVLGAVKSWSTGYDKLGVAVIKEGSMAI
jgi:hypothetical protein